MSKDEEMVVGRLTRLPQRPERLALVHADGQVSNWFARDQTREDIRAILHRDGLVLRDDDTVVPR
jgi:hypothetical protein